MIIEMQKDFFDSLSTEKVGHSCFEPMVPVYQSGMRRRSGQDTQEFRAEFYKSLSVGQRALFGFFTFYDHAIRSRDEFLTITVNYLSGQFFSIVKRGAEYFGIERMQNLLLEIEQAFNEQNDMLNARIDELYRRLLEIAPYTLGQIGLYVQENPEEFICLK